MDFDISLYDEGFLHKYAISNKWEDFTSFAEQIFINDPKFWNAVANHKKLRNKFELTCEFYGALDPFWSREYFLNLYANKL